MTHEREIELAVLAKRDGDRKAADSLARAHSHQVHANALRYRGYGVPVNELVAEGNLGLAQALRRFDPARGLRFSTYAAYWVRAQMLEHITNNWSVVSSGSRVLHTRWFFRLRRERAKLASSLGFGETAESEIAARLMLPVETLRGMLQRLDQRDASLNAPVAADTTVTLLDLLPAPDDQERSLHELRVQGCVEAAVAGALATLDPRERRIAERRLMADPGEESSLAELGRELRVSRERARQLETRTKLKLRSRIRALRDATVNECLALSFGRKPTRGSTRAA